MKNKKRKTEAIVIALIAVIAVIWIVVMYWSRPESAIVAVDHDGEIALEFNPDEDALYHIDGDYGGLDIEVKDGSWHVINEECPNHICAQMGWKNVDSIDYITCVPNGITIYLKETGS